jgi:hypothetical protein
MGARFFGISVSVGIDEEKKKRKRDDDAFFYTNTSMYATIARLDLERAKNKHTR